MVQGRRNQTGHFYWVYWVSSHFWDAVAPVVQSKDTHNSANVMTTDTMFVRWSTVYRYYGLLHISSSVHSCRLLSLKQTDSVGFWFVEQLFEFFFRGCLFLLHQISMALGNTPRIRDRHGGTLGTTGGWLQVLPVITSGSKSQQT